MHSKTPEKRDLIHNFENVQNRIGGGHIEEKRLIKHIHHAPRPMGAC